ncbi:hypothetical protein [Thiorhodovibrio frisius]|uniref:Uncharacterized protein n=1 Tax=Thiorhodovibrio frisius TaxID=631362 RepID=H8Z0W1_9GAMM|nr:hypothetical protein [Thiorhodovibrio frisius]EIC21343.1 hypothetical protein Thi970DRAFT_01548 [Thiorhodovibrio frisius]WPL23927.1 hypothetical protein Thiofri_04136 [Thiorhodovibrio frisius]
MQPAAARQALNWAGSAIAIAAIGFVLTRLLEQGAALKLAHIGARALLTLATLSALHTAANLWLAGAWRCLLAREGLHPGWRLTTSIFGRSQLAKYLPGNIFHLGTRQALGMAAGLPGWALGRSAIWELALLVATGLVFGLLTTPLLAGPILLHVVSSAVATFAGIMWLFATLARHLAGREIARAVVRYALFLSGSGAIFLLLLLNIAPHPPAPIWWPIIIGGYVLAWLVGLLTPGAPAGVGVREAALLFLFSEQLPPDLLPPDLLAAVLLARVVTLFGDLGFFLLASLMRSRSKGGQSHCAVSDPLAGPTGRNPNCRSV